MGGLLLCSSRRAESPYFIGEGEGEIWSVEELCRYLYENIYSVTEEFFSPELFAFLEELNRGDLAGELAACRDRNGNFAEMILIVCGAANYYDKEELAALKGRLYDFAALSRVERLKKLADSCMEKRRYMQALKRYEEILSLRKREPCDELLTGKAYHNMGAACAKMLLYKEAEEYLKKSAVLLPDTEVVKKELLLLYYLSGDTKKYEEAAEGFSLEERRKLEAEWEGIKAAASVEKGRSEAVIEKWKQEYRRQMS